MGRGTERREKGEDRRKERCGRGKETREEENWEEGVKRGR